MKRLLCLLAALACPLSAAAETKPLSLEEALRIARQKSPVLQRARAETEAAEARVRGTRSRLLPQVVGTATYQRTTANIVQRPGFAVGGAPSIVVLDNDAPTPEQARDPSGIPLIVRSQRPTRGKFEAVHSYNFQLVLNQLIYDFGASTSGLKADRELSRAQGQNEKTRVMDTELAVRNAFFVARANRSLVRVAEETLANQNRHLEQVQAFVEVGTRPEIDLAQSRTDVANARVQLLQAKNDYAVAQRNLMAVLGVEEGTLYEVTEDTMAPLAEEDASLALVVQKAFEGRPEVAAADHTLSSLNMRTRATKGRWGPALTANAATSKAGIHIDDLTWNAYVGATLSWSILDSGTTYHATREAEANRRAAEADLRALLLQIRSEVEQAHLSVQAAKATVDASGEALANARARLSLAEGRYEAGVGNAIELGDAQLSLTMADAQRVQSEYNLAMARAQLLRALGKAQ